MTAGKVSRTAVLDRSRRDQDDARFLPEIRRDLQPVASPPYDASFIESVRSARKP